jgi:hypothetical protein
MPESTEYPCGAQADESQSYGDYVPKDIGATIYPSGLCRVMRCLPDSTAIS